MGTKKISQTVHKTTLGDADRLVIGINGSDQLGYITKAEFEAQFGGFIDSRTVGVADLLQVYNDTLTYSLYDPAKINAYIVASPGNYDEFVDEGGDSRFDFTDAAYVNTHDILMIRNTDGEWVIDSKAKAAGPVGPTGPQGPIGATGPAGPQGPAGEVNNLTADLEPGNTAAIESGSVYDALNAVRTKNLFNADIAEPISGLPGYVGVDVPVTAGQTYIISKETATFTVRTYYLDSSKAEISQQWEFGLPFTVPTGTSYVRVRAATTDDISKWQMELGTTATAWEPWGYVKGAENFWKHADFNPGQKQNNTFNVNQDYGMTLSERNGIRTLFNTYASVMIAETNAYVRSCGVFESISTNATFDPTPPTKNASIYIDVPTGPRKKYLYVQTLMTTNDSNPLAKISGQQYGFAAPSVEVEAVLVNTTGSEKTYRVTGKLIPNNVTGGGQVFLTFSDLDNNGTALTAAVRFSGLAVYEFNEDEKAVATPEFMLHPLKGTEYMNAEARYLVSLKDTQSPIETLDKKRRRKKWLVFGTSIETNLSGSGNSWPERLGKIMNCSVILQAMGGSKITWDTTLTPGFDYVNSPEISQQDRCLTASQADREAFMASVNRLAAVRNNAAEIALCYDNSLFPYVNDVDVIIIGTYGANDPINMPASAEAACKHTFPDGSFTYLPNKRALMASVSEADKFDRTTLFGAYNFFIQKIRQQYPKAKIILTGMNNYAWDKMYKAHEIVRVIADLWNIPFLDMASHLGQSEMTVNGAPGQPGYQTARQLIGETSDVHPWTPESRQWMAEMLSGQIYPHLHERAFTA